MHWTDFGTQLDALNSTEQALFTETVRRLLAQSWVWRDADDDRRSYNFLARHEALCRQYLSLAGWELHHADTLRIFHLRATDHTHRRRLSKGVTLWLLVTRLIYQEQREQNRTSLHALPLIKVSDLYDRYRSYFPGQVVRVKGEFTDALGELRALQLIRVPEGGAPRADTPDKLLELLPTLEIILNANTLAELTALIQQYQKDAGDAREGEAA